MNDFNLCNNCKYFNCCHFWDGGTNAFCRKGIELCEISKKKKDKERKDAFSDLESEEKEKSYFKKGE